MLSILLSNSMLAASDNVVAALRGWGLTKVGRAYPPDLAKP